MKNLLILFTFVVFASCGSSNEQGASSDVQSIDLTGFNIVDLPNGYQHVIKSKPDGKVIEEGMLKNGKRNGTWIVYNDKRPLPKSVANFVDDVFTGPYMEYSSTGQLELVARYKNNQLNGKFIRVKNTRLLEEGFYIDGQIDGNYKKFYPNKDVLQQENGYKVGVLHGTTKYYNEEGQVVMEYEYKDGEKISGGMVTPGQ